MMYNHDRKLESFQSEIKIIREAGFNPIGVSQMYTYDVFIFETAEEAHKAYLTLEKNSDHGLCAWWYSRDDFTKDAEEYEKEYRVKVKVIWL